LSTMKAGAAGAASVVAGAVSCAKAATVPIALRMSVPIRALRANGARVLEIFIDISTKI
jgi:hypothetical protein